MKRNHKHTKLFYRFLVENGVLFKFLEILGNTKYKSFYEHCAINKPTHFIKNAVTFGVPYFQTVQNRLTHSMSMHEINRLTHLMGMHEINTERYFWNSLNTDWLLFLQRSKL